MKFLLLENVGNIISKKMHVVFTLVLKWLLIIGFTTLKWITIYAKDVGSPQSRKRWFLLASKPDADISRLQRLLPCHIEQIRGLTNKPWNETNTVPVEQWLDATSSASSKERLLQLGNAVVPKCAETALTLLAIA